MKHDQERTEGDSAPNILENLGDGPREGEYGKRDKQKGKVNWEALIGVKAGSADSESRLLESKNCLKILNLLELDLKSASFCWVWSSDDFWPARLQGKKTSITP